MTLAKAIPSENYFKWVEGLTISEKLTLSLFFAAITGLFAQIRIPLPWTPVPITGQVFMVLMAGILLRGIYGGVSMAFYLILGITGIPWFAGARPGLPLSPTTGYIIGFIPAALFVGLNGFRNKKFLWQIFVMSVAVSIIYFFGGLYLAIFLKIGLKETLLMGILPFIPIDFIKAMLAATISSLLLSSNQMDHKDEGDI